MTATNVVGTGAPSPASSAATPVTLPGAPSEVSAVAGTRQASVSFGAAPDGGSAVTAYTVTASPSGLQATGTASPLTVSGLADGTAYRFSVTATNAAGTGPGSALSAAVTTTAAVEPPAPAPSPSSSPPVVPGRDTTAPSAPGSLRGSFLGGALLLRWAASGDDVGIAGYRISLDGTSLRTTRAGTLAATTIGFRPVGRSVYTLTAFDAAGNESAASTPVVVVPRTRAAAAPRTIPRWAWTLLAWQQGGRDTRRPATPARVPAWHAAWQAWRVAPFRIVD